MGDSLSNFFEEPEFGGETSLTGVASPDDLDLFSIFESLEGVSEVPPLEETVLGSKEGEETARLVSQKSTSSSALQESETELEASPKRKRPKLAAPTSSEEGNPDGQQRVSHITVERNRRKQMNEHLSVLRSLMPCFYVKRVSLSFISFLSFNTMKLFLILNVNRVWLLTELHVEKN